MFPNIPDYRIIKILYQSSKSILYLAVRDSDGLQVVIKMLANEYPNHQQIARFLHEFDIQKKLAGVTNVAQAYSLEWSGHQQALVLEYIEGGDLSSILNPQQHNFMELFFKVAIQLARALAEIHQHGIIHKDIKPRNILWQTETETIKIIDFSIATELSREKQSQNEQLLIGSLPYLSPEQTGRMNRAVDYRSDFYSLGVTLYKLLCGQFPFEANENDPMAWIHCHIAKQPKPLVIKETALSSALFAIICKLMAKNAEDRYQSSLGLKNDLEYCYSQWRANGVVNDFVVGKHDISEHFDIPQKLYGREQEINLLFETFAEVVSGKCQLFLVRGFSGIGKSALINEIHKPIVSKNGYFISGKFDQFQRNIPYSALTQAFRELMKQLLTESAERLQNWREQLLTALGSNAQVLIDFIPELEQIIGPQQSVPHLGTEENQNRFNYLALQFLQLFASKKHPLVLFIDDLQWVDSASLNLIKLFMLSKDLGYFLLLSAYRNNEVDAYHPLMQMLEELKKTQVSVMALTLQPLQLEHVEQLVTEALNTSGQQAKPLAELVLNKTDGNPFFINQFLRNSYETNLLRFNVSEKSWQWELDKIAQQPSCENVVALMVAKMTRLPQASQDLLSLSSCIGNVFDLHTLAIISEKNVQQVAAELWPAVTSGLLVTDGDEHALLKNLVHNDTVIGQDFANAVDRFLHDRVQQAAYSLIEEEQKQQVHLKIARLLLKSTTAEELESACFDIVEHYNKSLSLLTEEQEYLHLAELNLIAGKKAKEATAYQPALLYFVNANHCLSQITQPVEQSLDFAIGKGLLECYILLGRIEEGLQQAEMLQERCCSISDKVELNNILILYYGGAGQMDRAIDIALDSLRLFEMDLPRNPNQIQLLLELAKAKFSLGHKTADELMHLPLIQDDRIHAIFSLLKELIAPTYLQGLTNLLPYIILRMFNLTLSYGNGPVASFAYSGYALLWSKLGNFAEAHRFGVLAMDYNKLVDNPPMEARCYFMCTSFALYWNQPLQDSQQPRKIGLQKLIDTGEYFWASYIYLFGFWQEVILSESLEDILLLSEREIQFAQKAKQIEPYYVHSLHHNLFSNLAGLSQYPESLDLSPGQENEALTYFKKNVTSTMGKFYHVVCRLLLYYYNEQYQQALAIATQADITEEVIRDGTYTRVIYTFYTCLTILALTVPNQKPSLYHPAYSKHKGRIKQWFALCPQNFAVMWHLLNAEEAKLNLDDALAIEQYAQALQAAKQMKSLWFEALVNELTAKFWLHRQQKIAAVFMLDARYLYYRWGAKRKIAELEKNYPELFQQKSYLITDNITTDSYTASSDNTSTTESALDIKTLLKASQTLSGEIVMDKLLQKLMHFLLENAGAQKGVLILKEQQQLLIEAECSLEQKQEVIQQRSLALENADSLAVMVVHYVARMKETVLVNDVATDSRFINDSYLQQAEVKSILCLPLLDKGQLSGVLYLENNTTSHAFTPDRVEILQILSAEIAISLENARLYRQLAQYNQSLEETVKKRTVDLEVVNQSLQKKNQQLQQATKLIEEKSNDITKSILYAQKIQAAMLPQSEKIAEILPEHFILFRPKEIVSGDFYWCNTCNQKIFVIVGDCTGHGVPGAFLSTIGHMLLNKIILEKQIFDPALILVALHQEVRSILRQQEKSRQAHDGMDIAVCQIDFSNQLILYAGARRPLYLVKKANHELIKITGDRKSIGGRQKEEFRRFTDHAITFSAGDMLYLVSDGLVDQHNANNQKFSSVKLEQTLSAIVDKDMEFQQQYLTEMLEQHQGAENQRDDVTLFGTRLGSNYSYSHELSEEKKLEVFDLLNFRQQLIENDVVLSFEGKMSQSVLVSLVETLKEKLVATNNDATLQMIRKIYGIFVELAQNIQNHSLEKVEVDQQPIGAGIIVIREDNHKFIITSGNKLLAMAAEKLCAYCDFINSLNEDELKKLYKEKLRIARNQEASGAGIGLIDIIRKSGQALIYNSQAIDENTQFFTLSIHLPKISA